MSFLSFEFTFEDLFDPLKLQALDGIFLSHLRESDEGLAKHLEQMRRTHGTSLEESALLLDVAPHVEDFLAVLFSIQGEVATLQAGTHSLAPLYRCKRLFVQRIAAKAYTREEALAFDGSALRSALGETATDLAFATRVLKALEEEDLPFLELATRYAAWSLHQDAPSLLFRLPRRDPAAGPRDVVGGWDALDQAHYCILCHNQGKDSCSKGLSEEKRGCPLGQKISEMNTLRVQGHVLGALAVIMIDNPMVAATGYRICNDCSKACIFQKQEPVHIPSIETQTLESVLNLPWGVEIYGLLSRWNPLNLSRPIAKAPSGYKVLVAGMGPAGFTLAHYLMNDGHQVVGIDGLKIEPLPRALLTQPIRDWHTLKEPRDTRLPAGFGGVAEYGITDRWDKNFLLLVRLLLERRSLFSLFDNVRLGSTLTLRQAFDLGVDHVALCLGAGQPTLLDIPHSLARGVRVASDFLMSLQLSGAALDNSLSNLQIRWPIVVIGGGLTAVDTATEAMKYYPRQVTKFLKRTEELGGLPSSLTPEEKAIAEEFLTHGRTLPPPSSTILYRQRLEDSPSYRLNREELDLTLTQGVEFRENTTLEAIQTDDFGHVESLLVRTPEGTQTLPCRTLLIATGTHPNRVLEEEDPDVTLEGEGFVLPYLAQQRISYFGDLHPQYQGNVVRAMASAKDGYAQITRTLGETKDPESLSLRSKSQDDTPHKNGVILRSPAGASSGPCFLDDRLTARVEAVQQLTPTIVEVTVKAPQAALNFKPGQFFRLQSYGAHAIEPLALTGASADPERGTVSLIVLEMGASSRLCRTLKAGDKVALMGPTGTPTIIPQGENALLIGGGLGNAVLFSIGQALKQNNNRVIYVAGYKTPDDLFKRDAIEAIADVVIWCTESPSLIPTSRPQDLSLQGNVIDGLLACAAALDTVHRIITIGSDAMMAAVACARKTVLKPYLNPQHIAIGSLNSPMQCMMKGICGQCIQTLVDPETGQRRVVFSCHAQDQNLDEIVFDDLHQRLKQNSLLEKQTDQWIQKWKNLSPSQADEFAMGKLRTGWKESFQLMTQNKDDILLDKDSSTHTWDEEEGEW